MDNNGFDRLLKKAETFAQTHTAIMLPERTALIKRQYKFLAEELEGEATCTICEEPKAVSITIIADSFLACDEAHTLNFLIGMANYSTIKIVAHKISIHLRFRCMDWIENNV